MSDIQAGGHGMTKAEMKAEYPDQWKSAMYTLGLELGFTLEELDDQVRDAGLGGLEEALENYVRGSG